MTDQQTHEKLGTVGHAGRRDHGLSAGPEVAAMTTWLALVLVGVVSYVLRLVPWVVLGRVAIPARGEAARSDAGFGGVPAPAPGCHRNTGTMAMPSCEQGWMRSTAARQPWKRIHWG